MGWHGVPNATPCAKGCQLFATPGNLFAIFSLEHYFLTKERSPEICAEFHNGHCDMLESSIFFCTHIIHLIAIT